MCEIRFIWDAEKNISNIMKHGVSFEDAVKAYYDPNRFDIYDEKHSSLEESRWIYLGVTNGNVLYVVETEPEETIVRIISARLATKNEQEAYYGNCD
jgi:uncharacterized DUF497 family protein